MKVLTTLTVSGGLNLASNSKDTFTIGTPLEHNDGLVDDLIVYANADFKNNIILGSSSIDTVTSNATITASSGITLNNNSNLFINGSGTIYRNGTDIIASISTGSSYSDQAIQQTSQSYSEYGGGAGSYLSGTALRDASNSGQGQIVVGHLSASGYNLNDDIISLTNANSRITMYSSDIKFEFLNNNQLLISEIYNALSGGGGGSGLTSIQSTGSGESLVRDGGNGTLRSLKSTSTVNVIQQTNELELSVNPNLTLTSLNSQGTLVVSGNVTLGNESSDVVTSTAQLTASNGIQTTTLKLNGSQLETAWTAYTPSWTASTTNPTLGNGTLTGYYKQIGKTVFVRVKLDWGSTTSGGSGDWRFSLPVSAVESDTIQMPCSILDVGNDWYEGTVNGRYAGLTDRSAILALAQSGHKSQAVAATHPFNWGNGDSLQFNGSYEAA